MFYYLDLIIIDLDSIRWQYIVLDIAHKVIPAIGQLWSQCHQNPPIRIQQDKARHPMAALLTPNQHCKPPLQRLDSISALIISQPTHQTPTYSISDFSFPFSRCSRTKQHTGAAVQGSRRLFQRAWAIELGESLPYSSNGLQRDHQS